MANNVYTVNGRLSQLENAVTELKKENSDLRVHLKGALETLVNDSRNILRGQIRDGIDGAHGKDGSDGVDGAQGIQGERGDVLIPNETELQQAVLDLRRKMLYQHAAHIAVLVKHIEHENKNDSGVHKHYAKLLEYIKGEIERLQTQ